ncbi:MAG: sulfate reduction electron transfer complex DsrMKJOP subunit DsrJ [Dehalococcoidia bacterium]
MYDKGKIIIGVIIFLAVFTIPFWYSQATGDADKSPYADTSKLIAEGKTCVEPADYMREHHVKLLTDWRNDVVRGADTIYTSEEYGTTFDKSLTNTCLEQCHTNKSQFCDQCHSYVGVKPNCWSCHNVVEEK